MTAHPHVRTRRLSVGGALALVCALASCSEGPPPPAPGAGHDDALQPTATVEELMRWLIDPAADAMWDAVVVTSTRDGIREERPETAEDWAALERDAILLVEAGNLLQMDGRAIAGAGSASELPGVDLEPADIAVRVAGDRDTWNRSARELHDVGVVLLDAVRARDVDALLEAGHRLDVACESCHSRFWYPPP